MRLPEDFERCVEFHGHICPGLVMGYLATKLGLEKLGERRAEDEELVAIVENDACFVDAVQVLSGCTFGKGNFIFKDYGKIAVTFLSRKSGEGVRVCLKPDAVASDPRHRELFQKIQQGNATEEEKEQFYKLHRERSLKILNTPPEEIFTVQEIRTELPPKARIEPSVLCSKCKEPVMKSRTVERENEVLCKSCAQV